MAAKRSKVRRKDKSTGSRFQWRRWLLLLLVAISLATLLYTLYLDHWATGQIDTAEVARVRERLAALGGDGPQIAGVDEDDRALVDVRHAQQTHVFQVGLRR